MKQMPNEKIVTLKLKRIDVCNLIMAANALSEGKNRERWKLLREKLKEILSDFDKKNDI